MLAFAPLLALVALVAAQADPSINTPASVVQCQPAQLTWTASRTPVFISVLPGGQVGATPLKDLGQQTGNSFTWNVDIPQGTQITIQIRDSTGVTAFSAPITVQPSSDSSCLSGGGSTTTGGAATSAASSTPAASSSAASASSESTSIASSVSSVVSQASTSATATAPATTSRATSAANTTSRAATATSAATSPTTSPNAASPNAKVGLAGLLGLAAAVVMA